MRNKNLLQRRNKARLRQENVPKLMLNKLNVKGNSTSIYTYWAPSSKKFKKKFPTYM
jgi:hypothetical protein